ncbi:MAG: glycine cleavage system protein H [Planctomycetaceae bacterium]|nr:glycine cleavage system protein H [Planctomycetaceae bacterium]
MSLVFSMGKYEAQIPTDRMYSDNHLWVQEAAGGFRVGFTAYSVRLLQDVYFLDWSVDSNTPVKRKQEIGEIESSKAVSTLYPPADGIIGHFNTALMDDPSVINTDNYEQGWLYTFETQARFMSPQEYVDFLGTKWDETQRMIKGQLND